MELIVPILVALVLVAVAWRILKGVMKTAALVVILVMAAVWVWGGVN